VIGVLLLALAAGDPVSVAVESDRKEYWLGESIPVRVRIEIDAKFLKENAVPLTLRKTDVPVRLEAPWLKGLPQGGGDATLAVNDDVSSARLEGDGAASTVLVLDRTLRPEKAGDLELSAPVLRFARASRFDEDPLGQRIALDRTEGSVKGTPLTIRVLPLPAEGRPAGFSGAVGKFTITATASPTEVEVGRSLHLGLVFGGTGDFAAVRAPRLDGLAGFHVVGWLDVGDGVRAFTYELEPLSAEVKEIPSIAFDYFDPAPPAGYRVARTAAIPLRVLPGASTPSPPAEKPEEGLPPALVVLAIVVAVATALLVGIRLRRSNRPTPPTRGTEGE
jgi:hypothetical protein